MRWNDLVARIKLYTLESLRILSVINFLMLALVWKKTYNIPNYLFTVFLVIGSVTTILLGYVLVKLFKQGEQDEIMRKTPQIMEMLEIMRGLKK